VTDDMSMKALSGDLGALTARAIAAGCDMALHCNGERAEMAAVVAAAGRLTPAAAARADAALAARRAPEPADMAAFAAELASLGGDV
jgi:beta-N-acetylhexosaminidase